MIGNQQAEIQVGTIQNISLKVEKNKCINTKLGITN